MGFFISEHFTVLSKEVDTIDFSEIADEEEKMFSLMQVYLNGQKIIFKNKG